MTNPKYKTLSLVLIGLGLLLGTILGLWLWKIGDTPAELPKSIRPKLLVRLVFGCAAILFAGIGMWIKHGGPRENLKRRVIISIVGLTLFVGVVFGVAFGIYAAWWERGAEICERAERLPTVHERRELMKTARGWQDAQFGDALDTIFSCSMAWHELDRLEQDGKCPTFPLPDIPCSCGDKATWPADLVCGDVPIVCSFGELRCAKPHEVR